MRRLEALAGVLLEAAPDDPLDVRGDRRGHLQQVLWLLLQDRVHGLDRRCSLKRPASAEHLVQGRAEREHVRALVGGKAQHLLWRHVADGAEHGPGLGEARIRLGSFTRARCASRRNLPRETEVEDLDSTVPGEEEILGLQVAVHDALVVGGGQPACDLGRDVERLSRGQRPAADAVAQGLALEQLRHQIDDLLVRADVVDGEHIGVVERARRPRFLLEAAEPVRASRERLWKDLERDVAAEARVVSPEHLAHAARAEQPEHLVGADARPGGEWHGGREAGAGL